MEDEYAISYEVLQSGVSVECADGTEVGTVEKTIKHEREHILDGIVLNTAQGRVFVDAPEVARITSQRVILTIDPAEVAALPRYP